jgi:hypothetical protein
MAVAGIHMSLASRRNRRDKVTNNAWPRLLSSRRDRVCQAAAATRMRRVREDWQLLGPSADVPDVWRHAVLRQFAEPARKQTRSRDYTSGDRIRTSRRALVILLSGRRVCRILGTAALQVWLIR